LVLKHYGLCHSPLSKDAPVTYTPTPAHEMRAYRVADHAVMARELDVLYETLDDSDRQYHFETLFDHCQQAAKELPLRSRAELRSLSCPHGFLFAVDEASPHATWEEVPERSATRKVDMALEADEASSALYSYVLTENTFHHGTWYRFRLTVDTDESPQPTYDLVLPTDHTQTAESAGAFGSESGVKLVRETKT
jgi:hypothetical protein